MFISEETICVNDKREAKNATKIDERKPWHPTKNSNFPLKLCLHFHHSDIADTKKKEIVHKKVCNGQIVYFQKEYWLLDGNIKMTWIMYQSELEHIK